MQWTDDAIVLGIRRHGEASAIAELFTREHGRHLGLVRGGFGSRLKPVLQPGNSVRAVWRARLDEHLGTYTVEPVKTRTASMFATGHALFGVTHLASLARLLPERDPHAVVYDDLEAILDRIDDTQSIAPQVARFEMQMLSELGFGLDLASCAATGVTDELIYVSPKSGRAVSREGGAAWADKLFRLPAFLHNSEIAPAPEDVTDAFALSGYFLSRLVLEPRGLTLSDARAHLIAAVSRSLPSVA
jgi:DNA repair protein RecO (recombination protein O)